MPLPKYYCDYCDKQFQYTTFARKHPNRLQAEGFGKGVCNHFIRTGFCQYGDSCKYFHPKPSLQNPSISGVMATNFAETVQPPINAGNQITRRGCSVPMDMIRDGMGISLGNLPPSLRPPPEGGYPTLPFVDWG
ncbi:hypothetical protein MKW94_008192 [Papaver nudicaule]|uniref:C3H1-type domain-containing protein n=1 Tax=Papaver nudicaule TaxID=74823 RepID=A0AA41V7Z1_PAPNU|nr:hypothetical protein [Papaver nudicaule]